MKKGLLYSTILDQEQRAIKLFLILFYSIGFTYDGFYFYLYPKYIKHTDIGLAEGGLSYGLYIIQLALLPIAFYLIRHNKPEKIKYIYLYVYLVIFTLNDLMVFAGNDIDYEPSNIGEALFVLFSPIFLNKRYFWIVFTAVIAKGLLLFAAIQQPKAIMPMVLYPILAALSLLMLTRFISYVNAIRNSLNMQMEGIVKGIVATLELKDPYTRGHSERVAHYSLLLAKRLGLFTEDDLKSFYYACLLHDVGKVNIPDHILTKPGPLTKEEFEIIKTHPTVGVNAIKDIEGVKDSVEVVLHHHERWDGRGYPHQLAGEQIPLKARITALADAFDAMTTQRSYREALTLEEAYERILQGKGSQFDPKIVDIFQEMFPLLANYVRSEPSRAVEGRTGSTLNV